MLPTPAASRCVCSVACLVLAASAAASRAAESARPPLVAAFERFGRAAADADGRIEAGLLLIGELGCTNCHAASPAAARHLHPKRGPVLDRVGDRLDPAWLEAYLGNPHATSPGTTMPDLLAGLPAADRAATTRALVHFLASTGSFDPVGKTWTGRPDPAAGAGLYERIGCAACHGSRTGDGEPLPDQRPLAGLDAKWSRAALAEFLRDPLATRPSSRMPAFPLGDDERWHLVASLLGPAADAGGGIVAFAGRAWHASGSALPAFDTLGPPVTSGPVRGLDVAALAGREHDFVARCEGFLHVPVAGRHRFHLTSDDGSRLSVAGRMVVENDGVHAAEEREGEIELAAGVHPVVIDYFQGGGERVLALDVTTPNGRRRSALPLITPTADGRPAAADEPADAGFALDQALVARGREAFAAVGCVACHALDAAGADAAGRGPPPALAALPAAPRGCLAPGVPPRGAAGYPLDDDQRATIAAAVAWLASPAAEAEPPRATSVARSLAALNCLACHDRDGRGGTLAAAGTVDEDGEVVLRDARRDRLFSAMVQELGDEGRLPPTLDGVGAKLTPKFLRTALVKGCNDRRLTMHARMPRWHPDVAEPLAAIVEQDEPVTAAVPALAGHTAGEIVDAGRFLSGSKGLGCIKCHSYSGDRGQSLGVIAMTRFPARLRHEWFMAYVENPQRFRPGTRMPAAWPEGKAFFPDVLDGTAAGQIEAVWQYVGSPERRPPPGTSANTIELVATDRPVIYRNFIEGAGPRAIGVGYPEGVNLAWDAEALRLALVWKGAFMDAGRHWSGRGEGWQPPLGDGVFSPDMAAAVEVLAAGDQPWPEEPPRQRGARFLGYVLDPAGRPTFRWSLAGMEVSERFEPALENGRPLVRRTIRLRGMPAGGEAVFRAARAEQIEEAGDGWLLIDGRWKLRLPGGLAIDRVERGGRQELRLVPPWVVADVLPGGVPPPPEALVVEELSW